MKIVGLDLSLTRTGISVISDGDHILTQSIVTGSRETLQSRIFDILSIIETTCMSGSPRVFIEEHLKGKNMTGKAYDRAELAGVVKFHLYTHDLSFWMVHPKTLKKYVTGSGLGEKDFMLHTVITRLGCPVKNNDEADAHAIADFGYHVLREDAPRRELLKYEKDVLKKWRKEHL